MAKSRVKEAKPNFVFLVNGEKGGVGKTQTSKILSYTLMKMGIDFYPVEADKSNPDLYLSSKEGECKLTFFSENEKKQNKADVLFDWAIQKNLVVSLPAQVATPLRSWLDRNNVVEELAKENVKIINLFVSSGRYVSVKLFQKYLSEMSEMISHVLVKNLRFREDWNRIDEKLTALDKPYQNLELPIIEYDEQDIIDGDNKDEKMLSFTEAIESDYLGTMQKRRVKRALSIFQENFEALGYV